MSIEDHKFMRYIGDGKFYIGDGAYAEHDGYGWKLSTNRMGLEHWVYLEPEVLAAFLCLVEIQAAKRRAAGIKHEAETSQEDR